jgi:hypothetical protein
MIALFSIKHEDAVHRVHLHQDHFPNGVGRGRSASTHSDETALLPSMGVDFALLLAAGIIKALSPAHGRCLSPEFACAVNLNLAPGLPKHRDWREMSYECSY